MLKILRRKRVWAPLCVVAAVLAYAISMNWHGVVEGVPYLIDGACYEPVAENPISRDGEFGVVYELVSASTRERMRIIKRVLTESGVDFEAIPVAEGYENIFVPGDLSEEFLIITAHYDKQVDDPTFHAATDNTGSVVALLAAIRELKDELPDRRVAFLFTALEERWLVGAYRFIKYADAQGYRIGGVLCFDMVGRGRPVAATTAETVGFRFHIPFYGSRLYTGRGFEDVPRLWAIDQSLTKTYLPGVPTYKAFLTSSDAIAFLESDIPAVHVIGGNMWHCERVWAQYTDTVDRLDQRDLRRCADLIKAAVAKMR
jgi:hypothetical protein